MSWKHERQAKVLAKHHNLTLSEASVLKAIAFFCFDDGPFQDHCTATSHRIASETGCNFQTVTRVTRKLEKLNLIARALSKGKIPQYHFPLPPDFDAYATDEQLKGQSSSVMNPTRENLAKASLAAALRAAGYDSTQEYEDEVFASAHEITYWEAKFADCWNPDGTPKQGDQNPGKVLMGILKGPKIDPETLKPVAGSTGEIGKPLPYDKHDRSDGLVSPSERHKFDSEY
jgi:hypothetical protein